MKVVPTVLGSLALVPFVALASGNPIQQQTLEQLQETCLQLQHEVDHGQLKPFTIDVECQRERTFWMEETQGYALPEGKWFTGSANVKGKYEVPAEMGEGSKTNAVKDCKIFKEYKKISIKVPLTVASCQDLLAIESLPRFCQDRLSKMQLDESNAIATGRVVDTCAMQTPSNCSPTQQQQGPVLDCAQQN